MKRLVTHVMCATALFVSATGSRVAAQIAQYEEPPYKIPPAITGSNGTVFIGSQSGMIFVSRNSNDTTTAPDTLRPGKTLPAELSAVWALSTPDRGDAWQLIVGLGSYTAAGGAKRYCILRSADRGATWAVIKPAAFETGAYTPTNDFYTQPFGAIRWLDADHGWIYGNKGILRTTDGGLTWDQVYTATTGDMQVKQIAFKDALNGVAAMGTYPRGRAIAVPSKMYFGVTRDGGATWEISNFGVAPKMVSSLSWVGGEYRALLVDPFSNTSNGQLYYCNDGIGYQWNLRYGLQVVTREQGLMSELLWLSAKRAVAVLRSGELWSTDDATKNFVTWNLLQNADSVNYPMKSSYSQRQGYGYCSAVLDGQWIVQTSTTATTADPFRRVRWALNNIAGSDASEPVPGGMTTAAYPNPCGADQVTLRVQLPRQGGLQVRFYDALGALVKNVDAGLCQAGMQSVALNLAGLPGGVYHYVAVCGAQQSAGTLSLTR